MNRISLLLGVVFPAIGLGQEAREFAPITEEIQWNVELIALSPDGSQLGVRHERRWRYPGVRFGDRNPALPRAGQLLRKYQFSQRD
jgi:hypothetical protein